MHRLFALVIFAACSPDKQSDDSGRIDSASTDTSIDSQCLTDTEYFSSVLAPILNDRCQSCHNEFGVASETQMVLSGDLAADQDTLTALAQVTEANGYLLWLKPTGQHSLGHVGGEALTPGTVEADALSLWIGRISEDVDDCETSHDVDSADVGVDCSEVSPGKRLLRRLSHVEYDNSISDLFGIESTFGSGFAPDNVSHGYNNGAEVLLVTDLLADQYMNAAESIASQVVYERLNDMLPCPLSNRNVNCAEDFLIEHGKRVFRRPLNDAEMTQYLGLFEEVYYEDGFNEAMKWTLAALLQSPQFLYRSELGLNDGNGSFELTDYEIATELSYLIWQTTPDDDLLTLAETGQLKDPATLFAMTQDMLSDSRAAQTIGAMATQWFSLDLLPIVPREGDYADLTESIRSAMGMEMDRFVQNAFSQDQSFADFITTDHSYLNEDLANYYGVAWNATEVDADGFALVDLSDDDRYGGLLTQGALMTVHALPVSSSPVHRGVLVRERFMCQELPPPPANLDTSPPAMDPALSTRERYEQHSSDPACSSCHDLIDSIGFGFEHYDGIGRYRDTDNGHAIDASGSVVNPGDSTLDFDGVAGLSELLKDNPLTSSCYVQQWFTFGFGVGDMSQADVSCAVDDATITHEVNGASLQSPLYGLTQLNRFVVREGGVDEGDSLSVPTDYVEANPVDTDDPGGENPDLDVYVHEDSNWGVGYCKSVTVTNVSGDSIVWVITLDVPGVVNSLWNAIGVETGNGDEMEFSGVSWNANLASGSSADFGFCANL